MYTRDINNIFYELRDIQKEFGDLTGEYNIYSSSKIYEIIIANTFGHHIVKGTHGADAQGYNKDYEYKHFKASSSNHTWTFNDYSEETLAKLKSKTILFVHINDVSTKTPFNYINWYYKVDGNIVAKYIDDWSKSSGNTRKMINISPLQLEKECGAKRIKPTSDSSNGHYADYIERIFECINYLEKITGTKNLLTSNKIWELFLANKLGHKINSKQGGYEGKHDAIDFHGRKFEYKISQKLSWTFEDASNTVIENTLMLDGIYVAVVDKNKFILEAKFLLDTKKTMDFVRKKRDAMIAKRLNENKSINRLNVSVSFSEAKKHNLIINRKDRD